MNPKQLQPNPGFYGNTTINYTIDDGKGGSTAVNRPLFVSDTITGNFSLDVDQDTHTWALSDGWMIIRKLLGSAFAGDALTDKAINPESNRFSSDVIHDFIARGMKIQAGQTYASLDVDHDGKVTALGDGLMIIRRLFGAAFTGTALINKAISPESPYFAQADAWQHVEANIDALIPEEEQF